MSGPVPLACALCAILDGPRILLLRRTRDPYRGWWSLPGGKIIAGETVEAAAEREAREETGLLCRCDRLAGVATETIRGPAGPEAHFILFVASLSPCGGSLAGGAEGEVRWFDLDALDERMIPSDLRLLRELVLPGSALRVPHLCVTRNDDAYRLA